LDSCIFENFKRLRTQATATPAQLALVRRPLAQATTCPAKGSWRH